jgi:hypothetical protein
MSKKSARATTIISLLGILAFAGVLSLWITTSARAQEVSSDPAPIVVEAVETVEATPDATEAVVEPMAVVEEVAPVVTDTEVVEISPVVDFVASTTDPVIATSTDLMATSTPEVQEVIPEVDEPVIQVVVAENPLVVSEEINAATSTPPVNNNPLVVSDEVSAKTSEVVPPSGNPLVVSDEVSAKTSDGGPPSTNPLVVSDEISATTSGGSDNPLVVSDEVSAKTTDSGGGCTSNCGGGGGGGSSGGGQRIITPPVAPASCPLYLTKYIRLGYNNDPFEVRKLQKFLRDFEGFNQVQITGFYDLTTYNAVRVFQMRYGKDVLNPWGLEIGDPTGFVFITTTYAINQIYCNRSTDNDFNLRHIYDEAPLVGRAYQPGEEAGGLIITNEPFGNIGTSTTSTTTATSTTATTTAKRGFFQAAAVGLLNFFTDHPGVWLTILLFVALLVLAYLILKLQEEEEETTATKDGDEWPEEVGLPSGAEAHQPIFPLIIAGEDEKKEDDNNKVFLEEVVMDESEEVPIPELGELESDDNGPESPRGRGRKRGK